MDARSCRDTKSAAWCRRTISSCVSQPDKMRARCCASCKAASQPAGNRSTKALLLNLQHPAGRSGCTPACRANCSASQCGWRCCALFFPSYRHLRVSGKPAPSTCQPAPWGAAQEDSSSPVRMAVLLAGGLRHLQRCAPSLQSFLLPKQESLSARLKPHLAVFLASWYDREVECVAGTAKYATQEHVERAVRGILAEAGVALSGIWLGSSKR